MKKFVRQKSSSSVPPDITLDFGAAATKIPRVYEPGEYRLRIESVRIIQSARNVLIALDLIELESGGRVDTLPLWVDGPAANAGDLAAKNQHVIAQLLTLAGLPTAGNVSSLIPKLAELEFDARLVLAVDGRSGRTHNELAEVFAAVDAP
jgi:hypothetical protein